MHFVAQFLQAGGELHEGAVACLNPRARLFLGALYSVDSKLVGQSFRLLGFAMAPTRDPVEVAVCLLQAGAPKVSCPDHICT